MTTMVTSTLEGQALLRELGADPARRGEFIDFATRYLHSAENDPPVAIALLQALVEAGLGGPARDLLQIRPELTPEQAPGLREALANLPSGIFAWEDTEETFRANLARLLRHQPHLQAFEHELIGALVDFVRYRSTDGQLHLSRHDDTGARHWLPAYHAASHGALKAELNAQSPPVAVIAAGGTPQAENVFAATIAEGGAITPLFIVEPSLSAFAAWLHTDASTELLDAPRVIVFVGHDAIEQFRQFLLDHDNIALPVRFMAPPWSSDLATASLRAAEQVSEARDQAMAGRVEQMARRDELRTNTDCADRLQPGATIVGLTSRFSTMTQYSMRDIGHAVEDLGYRFELGIESEDHSIHTALTAASLVADTDPALIVLINHYRYALPEIFGATPVLTWIQDPMDVVLSKQTGASMGTRDFACGYYRGRCINEFSYPADRFFAAPLPASERLFHDTPLSADDAATYGCDAMYVGHLHETAEQHVELWRSRAPASLHPLITEIHRRVVKLHQEGDFLSRQAAFDLVTEVADGTGMPSRDIESTTNFGAFRLFDILLRRQTLHTVARWATDHGRTFRLYGNGWDKDPVLAPFAVGPIEHGEPLRRAYRGARIALQTIAGGFKHQRTYEALLCGTIVLGRRNPNDFVDSPGTLDMFPQLAEVVFLDDASFAELAENLLEDSNGRTKLQAEFAAIVRREFTYRALVSGIIDRVRQELHRA